jgi:hypothetical protein
MGSEIMDQIARVMVVLVFGFMVFKGVRRGVDGKIDIGSLLVWSLGGLLTSFILWAFVESVF